MGADQIRRRHRNSNWQVVQLAVKKINDAGGIGGRPIELYLEDTASDPKVAVGNVRKLIQQHKVDVVSISAMREAASCFTSIPSFGNAPLISTAPDRPRRSNVTS